MEILTGVERRRRWSAEEKLRILAEAAVKGSCLSAIARQHDIRRQQLYQWRSDLRRGFLSSAPTGFVSVELAPEETVPGHESKAVLTCAHPIEIVLRNGRSLRVAHDVPDTVLHRMIRIAEAS
jgi:transposase